MEHTHRTEISSIGEFGLIDRITKDFVSVHDSTLKTVGDDGAVIRNNSDGEETVVTTDILVEGIHFDLSYCPLPYLGYKAVSVNISDLCAMNASPKQILISIAISNRFSVEAVEAIYEGVKNACEVYKIDLIGGDTTASNKGLIINVVAIGTAHAKNITYRSGAKSGDLLCISGDLGAAYVGLQILEREKAIFQQHPTTTPVLKGYDYIIQRQLKAEARTDITEFLKENNIIPTAMIDISDGLSSELLHLCRQSRAGAILYEAHIPIAKETYNTALEMNIDPINCALSGGEDYELLFTISPENKKLIEQHPDISIIGEILDENLGIKLLTKGNNLHDIIAMGWNSLKDEDRRQ